MAALILLQASAYLASIYLLCHIFRARGQDDRLLLGLAIVYPFGLVYAVPIMAEAWAMLGFSAIAVLFVTGNSARRIAIVGAIYGLIALLRSDLLLLPLLLMGLALLADWKSIARALPIPLAALAVLLPYTVWNGVHHGFWLPAPAASAVGTSLYLATWQRRLPLEDLNALYAGKVTPKVAATELDDPGDEWQGRCTSAARAL